MLGLLCIIRLCFNWTVYKYALVYILAVPFFASTFMSLELFVCYLVLVYLYNPLHFKRIRSIYSTSRDVFPCSIFCIVLYLYKNGGSYCREDALDTHVSCDVV